MVKYSEDAIRDRGGVGLNDKFEKRVRIADAESNVVVENVSDDQ
jgi:hypothetical protein